MTSLRVNMAFLLLTFCFLTELLSLESKAEPEMVLDSLPLPPGLQIGVGSSAYQIEGAFDQDGKGESCLDRYSRIKPHWNVDSSNGDVACNSYNMLEQDLAIIKNLNVDFYRFSLSWTRVIPNGDVTAGVNPAGVDYYHRLIDGLIKLGIRPVVTMFHWDLPVMLQELGGWANPEIVPYFEDYARFLFQEYGEQVKEWYTVNEPQLVGEFAYGGGPMGGEPYTPGVVAPGIGDYLAQHHMLIAHSKVYRLYKEEFFSKQNGLIGLTFNAFWAIPKSGSEGDKQATQRSLLFELDSVLHPVVYGDYPEEFKQILADRAAKEGRPRSRLPVFTPDQIQLMKGSVDFIGINHYSTWAVSEMSEAEVAGAKLSQARDAMINKEIPKGAEVHGVPWLADIPSGMRNILNYVREKYKNIPVYISENGCDDPSGLKDVHHITYIQGYLTELVKAKVEDRCNVLGYTIWSLMDSFEWAGGYRLKFGLYQVDFESEGKERRAKDSVEFVKNIISTRSVPLSISV